MFQKPFEEIDESDINELIKAGVTEGISLEYKKQVWGRGDEDVREMLRDVSAMANAFGGYILLGIDEEILTGAARSVENVPDAGTERDRLQSSFLANFEPRITAFKIKTLFVGSEEIILIKVPNSISLHQITFKGLGQFWKRHDRQKSRMSYDEIKDAIVISTTGNEETQVVLNKIISDYYGRRRTFYLTASPVRLYGDLFRLDNQEIRSTLKKSASNVGGWDWDIQTEMVKPTMKGLRIHDGMRIIELRRNGILDASVNIHDGYMLTFDREDDSVPKVIKSNALLQLTYNFFIKYQMLMELIGYDGPIVANIGLIDVGHYALNGNPDDSNHTLKLSFPEDKIMQFDQVVFDTINPKEITKELADRIWQAYGFENEPYYSGATFDFI